MERVGNGKKFVVIRVTGRIQCEDVETLRELLAQESDRVALDLGEATLVDWEVVRFLAFWAGNGVELRHSPGPPE